MMNPLTPYVNTPDLRDTAGTAYALVSGGCDDEGARAWIVRMMIPAIHRHMHNALTAAWDDWESKDVVTGYLIDAYDAAISLTSPGENMPDIDDEDDLVNALFKAEMRARKAGAHL